MQNWLHRAWVGGELEKWGTQQQGLSSWSLQRREEGVDKSESPLKGLVTEGVGSRHHQRWFQDERWDVTTHGREAFGRYRKELLSLAPGDIPFRFSLESIWNEKTITKTSFQSWWKTKWYFWRISPFKYEKLLIWWRVWSVPFVFYFVIAMPVYISWGIKSIGTKT